mgnify:CR=1 FL=1
MDHFELVSQYNPTGDQPQAIKELVEGFKEGTSVRRCLALLDLVRHLPCECHSTDEQADIDYCT